MDKSLAGLDQGELITIPSLPDSDWERMEMARNALSPNPFLDSTRLAMDWMWIQGCGVDRMLRRRDREIPLILQE